MKKRIFEAAAVGIFSVLFAAAAFWNRSLLEKQDPGQILSAETCGTDALSGEETAEASPVLVWAECVTMGKRSCTITFERMGPPYKDGQTDTDTARADECESTDAVRMEEYGSIGALFADYRLSVRDVDGGLLSAQMVPHFPVGFEETYWIRDFSGDGFVDIAFCTSCQTEEDYRRRDMKNTFLIWNVETSCFEEHILPLGEASAWESVGILLWNEELSSVISFAGDDDAGKPVLEMYSFIGGDWQKVRRLESIYAEDGSESPDRPEFMGQRRELLYVDGEVDGENILESNYEAGTIWCRRDSVWSRYYEGNLCLYPDPWYFNRIETPIGGMMAEKYVRVRQEDDAADLPACREEYDEESALWQEGADGLPAEQESGAYRRVYENWSRMREEWELPYVDTETFEFLLQCYENVDMSGEYEQGDQELYPLYLDAFYKLVKQDALVTDPENGETVVMSELSFFERPLYPLEEGEDAYQPEQYAYYFFDMDGDGAPELTVYQRAVGFLVFDYDLQTDSYSVWYDAEACWYMLSGSKKVLWAWDGGTYLAFYQLDENGEEGGQTFCLSGYYDGEQALYLVMLPKGRTFADTPDEGKAESSGAADEKQSENAGAGGALTGAAMPERMKAQGMYSVADDQWYFRVTGEQYSKITERYWDAYETADRRMDQEALTYEELFGTFLTEAGGNDDGNPVFDAGSRIGARIIARRVTWEEVRARELCDMENEGDYLLFEDLDSGKRFYVPDRYGEILDIQVTESGICIRSRQTASGFNRKEQEWYGKLKEHRIPGCFVFPLEGVIPICGGFGGYSHTVFLVGKEEADILPQNVWQEEFDYLGQSFSVIFERISPVYDEGFSESAHGYMADYCLTVTDLDGTVLSAQRIAGYPVSYEQVHWLNDFSGDGFPDLVFCTSVIDGTSYHTAQTHFLIWDADTQSYVVRPLPEPENDSWPRITGFVNWVPELTAVWTDMAADEHNNAVYGMFVYRDGEWELIRSLEQVYAETGQNSELPEDREEFLYYRELVYEGGRLVEENRVLFDEESVWDRTSVCLYPRDGWTWEERKVGGVLLGRYYTHE